MGRGLGREGRYLRHLPRTGEALRAEKKGGGVAGEADSLEDGQGDILLPGAILAHADAEARAEEQLACSHQVALL